MFTENTVCTLPEFPFKTSLSFEMLIDYWERISNKEGHPSQGFAKEIMQRLENAPELRRPIKDYSL